MEGASGSPMWLQFLSFIFTTYPAWPTVLHLHRIISALLTSQFTQHGMTHSPLYIAKADIDDHDRRHIVIGRTPAQNAEDTATACGSISSGGKRTRATAMHFMLTTACQGKHAPWKHRYAGLAVPIPLHMDLIENIQDCCNAAALTKTP